MKSKILLALAVFAFAACTDTRTTNMEETVTVKQEKARSDLLNSAVAKEFLKAGILIDCDLSACNQVSDESLQNLLAYKSLFVQFKDRINKVILTESPYPRYNYRQVSAFLPASLSRGVLSEFFTVMGSIYNLESQVGFRVEFPDTPYTKNSIEAFLKILSDNSVELRNENRRIELLVISDEATLFLGKSKLLNLNKNEVSQFYSELWLFVVEVLFKAQDYFGDVTFNVDRIDLKSIDAMNILLTTPSLFVPLFSNLQYREIAFKPEAARGYYDYHNKQYDLVLSNSFDQTYLAEALNDISRVERLSFEIGIRIEHYDDLILLQDHSECLDKIEALKADLQKKTRSIKLFTVVSGSNSSGISSNYSYYYKALTLNCSDSAAVLDLVVSTIP